jgi:hypothetical protein
VQEWGDWWMRHPAKGQNYIGNFCTKPDNIFSSGNCQFSSTVKNYQLGMDTSTVTYSKYESSLLTHPTAHVPLEDASHQNIFF